jgi:hypothetical protein
MVRTTLGQEGSPVYILQTAANARLRRYENENVSVEVIESIPFAKNAVARFYVKLEGLLQLSSTEMCPLPAGCFVLFNTVFWQSVPNLSSKRDSRSVSGDGIQVGDERGGRIVEPFD